MTNIKENYKSKVKTYQPKPPYVWNCVKPSGRRSDLYDRARSAEFLYPFFDFNEKTAEIQRRQR